MTWDIPVVKGVHGWGSGAPVLWILARPNDFPKHGFRWGQQGFRRGIKAQVQAKIHHQQSVISIFSEEAQNEGFRPQDSAVQSAMSLGTKHGFFASQFYQVAMERVNSRVALPFGDVEF